MGSLSSVCSDMTGKPLCFLKNAALQMEMGRGLQQQIVKNFNCCLAALAMGFHIFFFFPCERNLKQTDFDQEILTQQFTSLAFSSVAFAGCEHVNQETSLGVGGKVKSAEFFLPEGSRNENIDIVTSSTSAQEDLFHEKSHAVEHEVPGWSFSRDVGVLG